MKRPGSRQRSNSTSSGVVFTTVSLRAIGEISTGVDRMAALYRDVAHAWEPAPEVPANQTSTIASNTTSGLPVVMTPATAAPNGIGEADQTWQQGPAVASNTTAGTPVVLAPSPSPEVHTNIAAQSVPGWRRETRHGLSGLSAPR